MSKKSRKKKKRKRVEEKETYIRGFHYVLTLNMRMFQNHIHVLNKKKKMPFTNYKPQFGSSLLFLPQNTEKKIKTARTFFFFSVGLSIFSPNTNPKPYHQKRKRKEKIITIIRIHIPTTKNHHLLICER